MLDEPQQVIPIALYPEVKSHRVSRYLYSHFAEHLGRCIYEGIWVGDHPHIPNDQGIRLDTVEALKKVQLPALRWPGGCFADNYHWMDGIGPREKRPKRHNLWWNQPETNEFGTDEFMRFCQMIGTEPYLCLNIGSGTVEEASSWVEYCNSLQNTALVANRKANGHPEPYGVKFWGIGNENWGCGGSMHPEFYANLVRRYTTYLRGIAGPEAKMIACGSYPNLPDWDEKLLSTLRAGNCLHLIDYIALHNYLGQGKSDLDFTGDEYYALLASVEVTEKALVRACGFAQAFSSFGHRIGVILDEWGTWWKEATVPSGLYQQNTLQDALFTAWNFHLFHRLSEWLYMTNIAQTINVLQALILTKGPELIVTPTYHVYDLFKPHRDADLISCVAECPTIALPDGKQLKGMSFSATCSADGRETCVSVVNYDLTKSYSVNFSFPGSDGWQVAEIKRLTSTDIHDHNTFEHPEKVKVVVVEDGALSPLPPMSITTVRWSKS